MSKMLKEVITRDLERRFEGMDGFVAVDHKGLDAEETVELRKTLRESGARMRVVPNTLTRRVLSSRFGGETGEAGDGPAPLESLFTGPTALVVGGEPGGDPVIALAKAIVEWKKKHKDKLAIKGGALEGKLLSSDDVQQLAEIPDTMALYAQIAGMFQAPVRNLAVATQQIVARVVYALQAIKDKKEQDGGGE